MKSNFHDCPNEPQPLLRRPARLPGAEKSPELRPGDFRFPGGRKGTLRKKNRTAGVGIRKRRVYRVKTKRKNLFCVNDMQKEIDRLINSYRSNALSKEEAGMLAGWLEESDENRAYFRECLARRELPASAKAEREWARFAARNKILFAVPEVAGRRRSRFLRYVAAAAVVAAGVCAVWFWQRTPDVASEAGAGAEISAAQPLEYRTACGERLDIVLPDGSKVCMNSEATLTVDPGFGKATREIEFDGEAFFTISPDKNCPFIIHSANNNYTVLGTSFNLQSYARENFAVVTLHTGCLQAQARKDVIILDPLDTAIVFWIAASALSFILALFVSKKSHA